MNLERLQKDHERDLILGAAGRRRASRRMIRCVPLLLMLAAIPLWIHSHRGPSPSAPGVARENPSAEKFDPRETRVIRSDDELLSLLESFGPVLARREDGTQVLVLTMDRH